MAKESGKPKNLGGRPTIYSEELAEAICEVVATTPAGLQTICNSRPDFPDSSTVYLWLAKYDWFFDRYYNKAKVQQADVRAEQCVEIANNTSNDIIKDDNGKIILNSVGVLRARLQVSTLQWDAARNKPTKYGDKKADKEVDETEKIRNELRELRAKLDPQHRKEY